MKSREKREEMREKLSEAIFDYRSRPRTLEARFLELIIGHHASKEYIIFFFSERCGKL